MHKYFTLLRSERLLWEQICILDPIFCLHYINEPTRKFIKHLLVGQPGPRL